MARRFRELPVVDPRPIDEILGYDENGAAELMVVDTSAVVAILLREPEAQLHSQQRIA